MTTQEVKAAADKIVQEFQPYNQEYIEGSDMHFVDDVEGATECAIIKVTGILKEINVYKGNLNPRWEYWQSILTELKNR